VTVIGGGVTVIVAKAETVMVTGIETVLAGCVTVMVDGLAITVEVDVVVDVVQPMGKNIVTPNNPKIAIIRFISILFIDYGVPSFELNLVLDQYFVNIPKQR